MFLCKLHFQMHTINLMLFVALKISFTCVADILSILSKSCNQPHIIEFNELCSQHPSPYLELGVSTSWAPAQLGFFTWKQSSSSAQTRDKPEVLSSSLAQARDEPKVLSSGTAQAQLNRLVSSSAQPVKPQKLIFLKFLKQA